ncbi:hypothetical protein V6R21_18940 [Limibacter armeniacum]|uniref:hypothetical protein n=1 Tax=Limibacter armeniacum TaxID=466084 RepID=UPI002FE6BD71
METELELMIVEIDPTLTIRIHSSEDINNFVVTNTDAARALKVDPGYLRNIKSNNLDVLKRDSDWIIFRMPTAGGYQLTTCWSRQGIIKLCDFFSHPEARKLKQWAKDFTHADRKRKEHHSGALKDAQIELLMRIVNGEMSEQTRKEVMKAFETLRAIINNN